MASRTSSSTTDNRTGAPVPLLQAWDALYTFIGNREREFFFLTNNAAPNGRVIAVDIDKPDPDHWREVVPESDQAIEEVSRVGDNLIVSYIRDAHARVLRFDLDGKQLGPVELPGMGTAGGFAGTSADTETFFGYSDFTRPLTVFRLDISSGATTALRPGNTLVDPERFVQEQVFYPSRDGTRIPMFIIRPRERILDGTVPTVLYGYGGFRVSLLPGYSTARMAWLEAGGAIAVANLRGGGEYGTAWHDAGRVRNKQNVFDDFIAGAEWLIANDYTSAAHLGIWGGSNGGLLVAAVANQRPDLFAVAVPAVGVLDMLRYQTASANARQWSTDYGLSENPDEFPVLRSYSPYHNIRAGACYPATLIMADANDDRVAPWHSYKYAAALQRAQGCERPVLIRIETRTGHAGMVTSRFINEYADQWAMVADRLGLSPPGE